MRQAAHMIHVGMRNKDMPDLHKIHPLHISRMGTAFPGIKPVNAAVMFQNECSMMHPRHGFGPGTGTKNTDPHLSTNLSPLRQNSKTDYQ